MKIIKYICDRCKREIPSENYWSILIYENADSYGMQSAEGAAINCANNMEMISGKEKIYCKRCIREITKYINKRRIK